jgi:hypothetical protein
MDPLLKLQGIDHLYVDDKARMVPSFYSSYRHSLLYPEISYESDEKTWEQVLREDGKSFLPRDQWGHHSWILPDMMRDMLMMFAQYSWKKLR